MAQNRIIIIRESYMGDEIASSPDFIGILAMTLQVRIIWD
jgi:hypothetical protein